MAIDLLAVLTLVAGIYLLYGADKQKKSFPKIIQTVAGLTASLCGLIVLFGGAAYPVQIGAIPLIFGFFAIGAFQTKGNTQLVYGAAALLVFLKLII